MNIDINSMIYTHEPLEDYSKYVTAKKNNKLTGDSIINIRDNIFNEVFNDKFNGLPIEIVLELCREKYPEYFV